MTIDWKLLKSIQKKHLATLIGDLGLQEVYAIDLILFRRTMEPLIVSYTNPADSWSFADYEHFRTYRDQVINGFQAFCFCGYVSVDTGQKGQLNFELASLFINHLSQMPIHDYEYVQQALVRVIARFSDSDKTEMLKKEVVKAYNLTSDEELAKQVGTANRSYKYYRPSYFLDVVHDQKDCGSKCSSKL